MKLITSTQNSEIKNLLRLTKPRNRKKMKLFVIEGFREINLAQDSGYQIKDLFFCPELQNTSTQKSPDFIPAERKLEVSRNVFSRIAYRANYDGFLAVACMKEHGLKNLNHSAEGLYLVIESVEKPGNLGALLRTADAAGLDAVFICDNKTEIYNPNVIRSSLGCVFSNKLIQTSSESAIGFFKENNIRIYAAALQDSEIYYNAEFKAATAIVMGSEAKGLSGIWRENADKTISIPMAGLADSLNVSVSAAILIFEAVRQRNE